jgi:putative oxidoreductase
MTFLTGKMARWIFSFPFVIFGICHLMNADKMAGLVDGKFPGDARMWVYVTGICLIASGVAIAIQKFDRIAALGLALMLFIFIAVIHAPGLSESNEMSKMLAVVSMLKDLSLAGGALTYAGLAKS